MVVPEARYVTTADPDEESNFISQYARTGIQKTKGEVKDIATEWEMCKVHAALMGFCLSSAEEELMRIEHGRVFSWDNPRMHRPISRNLRDYEYKYYSEERG